MYYEWKRSGALVCYQYSSILDSLVKNIYFGYSLPEAKKLFKQYVNELENMEKIKILCLNS